MFMGDLPSELNLIKYSTYQHVSKYTSIFSWYQSDILSQAHLLGHLMKRDFMNKKEFTSVQYLTINQDMAGQRVDNFLISKLKGVPKTHIYRIIRKGEVRINKKRILASYKLQNNDILRLPPVVVKEKTPPQAPGQSLMKLLAASILYEDKNLLIINKPSGIPVHGGSKVKLGLVEALRCMYPRLPHLELAHRLDADTSGCLILAKKPSILKELHELMRNGSITKIYYTLTKGQWRPEDYRVEAALRKNELQSGERMVRVDKEGKSALTIFDLIENYKDVSLMSAHLITGRTHQIRVHARYKQHPIAGDDKYGDKDLNKKMRQYGLKRLFLHAYSIEFDLPSIKQHVRVVAPLSTDLTYCLEKLKASKL